MKPATSKVTLHLIVWHSALKGAGLQTLRKKGSEIGLAHNKSCSLVCNRAFDCD